MKLEHLKLNTTNTALLVIDPQKDFFTGDSPEELKPLHIALSKLNTFIKSIKKLGIPVIFTKYIEKDGNIPQNIKEKGLDGSGVIGSGGEEFIGVDSEDADKIILKNTWDAFSNPELDAYLKEMQVQNLLITGVDTEVCVLSSISSAFSKGYSIIVMKDLVATENGKADLHEMILKIIDEYYGYVIESNELLECFE